jgi:hypothetical protein
VLRLCYNFDKKVTHSQIELGKIIRKALKQAKIRI